MKGFKIRSTTREGEVYKAAIPDGMVDVTVNVTRYDGAYWSAGGLKEGKVHIVWECGGGLKAGDEIVVEFTELDEATPYVELETHASCVKRMEAVEEDDDPEVWRRKLERYRRLKKILEEEQKI